MKTLTSKQLFSYLKPRPRDAHKGDFGHVLIIGGDDGMAGAVCLAAQAALRVGAGLVSVATHPEFVSLVTSTQPEIMCHGVEKAKQLAPLFKHATVIVLGPGLGKSSWSRQLFTASIKTAQPKVVDADALNLLCNTTLKSNRWILTPHPGETARLLQCSRETIQANRVKAIQQLKKSRDGVIVLKGAGTLVLGDGQTPKICRAGNPGMASGGMGDVLSGVIGGLLAQGLPLQAAAETGVLLHAMAGDLAAKEGERGLIASDLMTFLRKLIK